MLRRTARFTLPLLCCLSAPAFAAPTASDAAFKAIYEAEWQWRLREIGVEDDEDEAQRISATFRDVSVPAQQARQLYLERTLTAVDAIDPSSLSDAARIDRAVYRAQIEALIARQKFRDYEKPLSSSGGFWNGVAAEARKPFRTAADYEAFVERLQAVPRHFDDQIANMRAGLARGFTAPRVTLVGRDAPIAAVAEAKRAEDTPFYEPFKTMPAAIPADRQAALRAAAKQAIEGSVVPAYRKLLAFMRDVYVPGARTTLAAEALPDGKAYYRSKIREFVTLDLPPEEIHAIGLAEVAKLRAEMVATMKETGFAGDLPAFLEYLRTDPRFYPRNEEDLLREASWISKRFDAIAHQWFGLMPRRRFGITPMPAATAPFSTYALGGPGYYLINTYDLPSRPLYVLTALTLHEAAPGHAFQMPLAAETDQPAFRQKVYMSAYGEGWALYCEKLGVEMGMYRTPYDRFGMLNYQIWRAARLVVDTGIHSKGWSRDRAVQYMRDNTSLSAREISTEVDRYIAGPGQALSYYLGEMAIVKARAKAEATLDGAFDIRAFHDAVLATGSVPLPVLEAHIDAFITRAKRDGGGGT